MFKRNAILVVITSMLVSAAAAAANETVPRSVDVETQVVRLDDLDLRKPAGVEALHWRLRVASSNVCRHSGEGLRGTQLRRKCRTAAMERAMTRLPRSVLTYHTEWLSRSTDWLEEPREPAAHRLASKR